MGEVKQEGRRAVAGAQEEIVRENKRLRQELDKVRRSYSFRLGNILIEAVLSPLKGLPGLPRALFHLVRDYRADRARESGKPGVVSPANSPVSDRANLNIHEHYRYPGIEAHNCRLFSEHSAFRDSPNRSMRVATIISERLALLVGWEASCKPLHPDNWALELDKENPEMLLLEMPYGRSPSQPDSVFFDDECELLKQVFGWCKARKVPVCLWDSRPDSVSNFIEIPEEHIEVFCVTDPERAANLNGTQEKSVISLGPLVQPILHNPVQPVSSRADRDRSGILFDGWADAVEWPRDFEFLEEFKQYGLIITESRYRFMANKLNDLPALRSSIHGNIEYEQLLTAYRRCAVVLMSSKSLSSTTKQAQKAVEAVACGASVVWIGPLPKAVPQEAVWAARDSEEAARLCESLIENGVNISIENERKRRYVNSNLSISSRFNRILESVGIRDTWEQFPKASLITPCKRPSMLSNAIRNFNEQDYPNLEWIIVLNTDSPKQSEIPEEIKYAENVQIHYMHSEKNIGTCLNLGIFRATGEYWFKFDDDDCYGSYYVSDMVQEARWVDADVFGKPTAFIYFEENDNLMLRNAAVGAEYLFGEEDAPHICGATISGRRKSGPEIGFSEDLRASVDTDYIRRCGNRGCRILTSSIFGFVAIRSKSKEGHTWRAGDEVVKRNSKKIGDKTDIDAVLQ